MYGLADFVQHLFSHNVACCLNTKKKNALKQRSIEGRLAAGMTSIVRDKKFVSETSDS